MKLLGFYKNKEGFKIILLVAIIIIGYIASVFYNQIQKLDTTVELISKSTQTQYELEKLTSIVSDYEMNLRNYIITRDDSYLEDRFFDKGEIETSLEKLKKIAYKNPRKIKDVDSLKNLIDYRFKLFRDILMIQKSKKKNRGELKSKLLENSSCTESMRVFVYKRINDEINNVKYYNLNHQFELEDSMISAFLLVILSLLLLLLSFNKINIDIDELKKANDELKFLNHSFKNAEKIAGFGHWKYNIDTNVYEFSDNYYRLLGLEPHSFEPTIENAAKFIHPDDYEMAVALHKKSIIDHQPTSIMLRWILGDGTIKYLMTVGSFTTDSKGHLIKIGVNYDITDQYKKTLEVIEFNKQLKETNEELDSFNNIVSHDLQEPLRKIQMFVSRLDENEADLLSEQGKGYFEKIRSAANRMQTLLIDLLNYSRTTKGDENFENVNLNELLQKLTEVLATDIEEKNALVEIGNLPEINGIGFQMEVLFTNLICNSLKYSKIDERPIIKVKLLKISDQETYNDRIITNKEFYKIAVIDNGIGFKQEYAENIFLLFKRLETGAKYTGTGIGLAICKRIVENHKGFIRVKSKPDQGAQFFVYIPKELSV